MKEIFSGMSADFISAGVIILITIIANKFIKRLINKAIEKNGNKHKKTLFIFIKRLIKYVVYLIGMLLALAQFNIFTTLSITLLSALGVIVTIVGLSFQDSLSNLLGSFDLVINRPFEVGDFIKLPEKNISGTVEEIALRHTVIKTVYNQREIIPNGLLNDLIVENSDFKENEICLFEEYSIAYTADAEKAIEIMKEELQEICGEIKFSKSNKDIEFPKVRVTKWDNSAIKLRAYVWGNSIGEAYEHLFELNRKLKKRYSEEEIEIPYDYINVINKKEK